MNLNFGHLLRIHSGQTSFFLNVFFSLSNCKVLQLHLLSNYWSNPNHTADFLVLLFNKCCSLSCKEVTSLYLLRYTEFRHTENKRRHTESAAIWKLKPLPIFQKEKFRQGPMCGILPGREREAL